MGERALEDNAPCPHMNHDVALCLGDSDDIMTPLILAPRVDVIFMVGLHTQEQIDTMIATLREGKREAKVDNLPNARFSSTPILEKTAFHYLPEGKADIMMYAPYRKRPAHMEWHRRLRFRYGGKERVVFFFTQSAYDRWPSCVTNLSHIFVLGYMMNMNTIRVVLDNDEHAFGVITCGGRGRMTKMYADYTTCSCSQYVVVKNGTGKRGVILGCLTLKLGMPQKLAIDATVNTTKPRACELRVLDTGRVYRTTYIPWKL